GEEHEQPHPPRGGELLLVEDLGAGPLGGGPAGFAGAVGRGRTGGRRTGHASSVSRLRPGSGALEWGTVNDQSTGHRPPSGNGRPLSIALQALDPDLPLPVYAK